MDTSKAKQAEAEFEEVLWRLRLANLVTWALAKCAPSAAWGGY